MKIALIAGASGLVGSELLQSLIENDTYKTIHILSRRSLKIKSSKIVEHIISFDKLENFELDQKIDHVFCTLGTTIKKAKSKENFRKIDYDYVLTLGKKAKLWNADKFLIVKDHGVDIYGYDPYLLITGVRNKFDIEFIDSLDNLEFLE